MTINGVKEDTNLLHNLPVDIQKEIMMMVNRQKKIEKFFAPWTFAFQERKTRKACAWSELVMDQQKLWKKEYNITEFRPFEEWLYRPFGSLNVLWFDEVWAICMKNELDGAFGWGSYVEKTKLIKCECGKEMKVINTNHIKSKVHQSWLNSH
jgi:hypothetical protein